MSSSGLRNDLLPFLDDEGERLVHNYYGTDRYTGPWFDFIPRGSEDLDRFTWDDVAAVSMLGVQIPPRAGIRIVEEDHDDSVSLLEQIPTDLSIFDREAEDHLRDDGPADTAWQKLDGIPGVGWVTANKLLARKRPRLLPVYDRFVKDALQPDEDLFWLPLHRTLTGPHGQQLQSRLQEIHARCGLDEQVSLLRILDVAVWMEASGTES